MNLWMNIETSPWIGYYHAVFQCANSLSECSQRMHCFVCVFFIVFLIAGLCAHAPVTYHLPVRHVSQCQHYLKTKFSAQLKEVCQVTTTEVLKALNSVSF